MIPNSVFLFLTVEGLLISLTTLLMAQPAVLFKPTSKGFQTWAFRSGCLVLVILFGWSVLFGRILSNYEISIRF